MFWNSNCEQVDYKCVSGHYVFVFDLLNLW